MCPAQLRKIKDLPRILQRLRLTQGLLDSRDFQSMLDRYCSGSRLALPPAAKNAGLHKLQKLGYGRCSPC